MDETVHKFYMKRDLIDSNFAVKTAIFNAKGRFRA